MENWKKLKELACREIDHRGEELIAFGTDIWNHPETGYCEVRTARAAAENANVAQPEKAESKTKEQKRAEAEERNRLYRAKKGFVDRLKAVEEEISKGEARKTEINELLCSQEVLSDSGRIQELMIELKEKENSLKALYDEWEELSLKIEEIK